MKLNLVLLAIIMTSLNTFATETNQEVSCQLTKESLDSLNGYIDPGGLGIWFQSIPENFQLAISSDKILLKYNYRDSVGIKGESFESAWDGDASIKFANNNTSNRNGSKYGRDTSASVKISDRVASGKYASKYLSPMTSSGKSVKQSYKLKFNRLDLTGTLKTKNKLDGYFSKFSEYDLEFTCN